MQHRAAPDSGRASPSGARPAAPGDEPSASAISLGSSRRVVWLGGLSAVLLWAALPPLGLAPLGFVGPVGLVLLLRCERLPGRRPYGVVYAAGFVFWLLALHWVRLSHPAAYLGWVALAWYFAFYWPAFVAIGRVAVHRFRMPIVVVAPVVWTGLELFRGHFLTGMTMASLGHTQYRWVALVQVADLAGAYGVSFVVMFVAASVARALPFEGRRATPAPLLAAAVLLGGALCYGRARQLPSEAAAATVRPGSRQAQPSDTPSPAPSGAPSARPLRVALIQGSIDTDVKFDDAKRQYVYEHYLALSREALRRFGQVDLMVWPETMLRFPVVLGEPGAPKPPTFPGSQQEFDDWLAEAAPGSRIELGRTPRALGVPMILGVETWYFAKDRARSYNSAMFVDASGAWRGRYDKCHLVVFGEYVPWADHLPALWYLTPISVGVSPGAGPVVFELGGWKLAPNICYETVIPHFIRRQVNQLRRLGREPDVLVNLTNDGWFRGSSELEQHLACSVFRAVECRKPMLIAANTGISAWIDSDGRILAEGPKRDTAVLLAEPRPGRRRSWYLDHGDLPAGACLAFSALAAVIGLGHRWVGWRRARRAHCALAAGDASPST